MAWAHISSASQQVMCDAFVDQYDDGTGASYIEFYANDGDGIPASVATAITDQTLLGTVTCSDPAFGAASSSGVATANSITDDSSADASGTAAWARHYDGDGTAIADVDVGATGSGATIELSTTTITAGGAIQVTAYTWTMPDGT